MARRIGMLLVVVGLVLLAVAAVAGRSANDASRLEQRYRAIPRTFVRDALCVHSGWRYSIVQLGHVRPGDVYLAHGWYRPVARVASHGEDRWHSDFASGFGGGLEWTLGTWREAGGVGSPSDARPAEEVFRARVIVLRRGTWLHDWPNTARACGLR
jgi:hypothetical protein